MWGFSWYGLLVAYIGLPITAILFLGYKLVRRSRPAAPSQIDLSAPEIG